MLISLITVLFLAIFLCYEAEMNSYMLIFGAEILRFRIVMENMASFPDVGLARRIIFDFLRCISIPICKMYLMGKIDYTGLMSQVPSILIVMAVCYIISSKGFQAYYSKQRWIRTVVNLEFQHLKSIGYHQTLLKFIKMFPTNPMLACFVTDIPEGLIVFAIYIVEQIVTKTKVNFDPLVKNAKIYLAVNLVTMMYLALKQKSEDKHYFEGHNNVDRTYRYLVYTILVACNADKLQVYYKETPIVGTGFELMKKAISTVLDSRKVLSVKCACKNKKMDLMAASESSPTFTEPAKGSDKADERTEDSSSDRSKDD